MRPLLVPTMMVLAFLSACEIRAQEQAEAQVAPVVFVCEHGNVKSLIGASLFDQVARERGLPFRAVSRGVSPEPSVPPKIIEALREDGIDVAGFQPQRLSSSDFAKGARVVAIGVDVSPFSNNSSASVERWDDVPPASVDYAASRASLLRHIRALMDQLVMAR